MYKLGSCSCEAYGHPNPTWHPHVRLAAHGLRPHGVQLRKGGPQRARLYGAVRHGGGQLPRQARAGPGHVAGGTGEGGEGVRGTSWDSGGKPGHVRCRLGWGWGEGWRQIGGNKGVVLRE